MVARLCCTLSTLKIRKSARVRTYHTGTIRSVCVADRDRHRFSCQRNHPTKISALIPMLNFAPLPDLLALTILVFVFWSILRRRAGGKLQAWLLGWIFILLHFAAQLFGGRPGGLQTFVFAVSAIMLELAGAAFIYAAGGAYYSLRMRWIAATGLTGDPALYPARLPEHCNNVTGITPPLRCCLPR